MVGKGGEPAVAGSRLHVLVLARRDGGRHRDEPVAMGGRPDAEEVVLGEHRPVGDLRAVEAAEAADEVVPREGPRRGASSAAGS
eukprot:13297668-Alexandrium_andersonii.AAC.1